MNIQKCDKIVVYDGFCTCDFAGVELHWIGPGWYAMERVPVGMGEFELGWYGWGDEPPPDHIKDHAIWLDGVTAPKGAIKIAWGHCVPPGVVLPDE